MGRFKTISGFKKLRTVRLLDQKPIGKSSRSNPMTYMKGYDDVRKIFAATIESKRRGFSPSTFSFNTSGGRCDACNGEGIQKIEMHFLADIQLTCEYCKGRKFKKEVLEVKFNGKNISDVLSMTVDEAAQFFLAFKAIRKKLKILQDVGLGYLEIGQEAPTLSGGEAQRLKIAKELSIDMTNTLYILDEPTTGLHLHDIKKLLEVLNTLIEKKNSVVVIDLGPEGGEGGGTIIGTGTPEAISKIKKSYTGQHLKRAFKRT